MRYAFEYFIRNEFDEKELGYNLADTQYNFYLSIGKIIAILGGYFIGVIIITIILLKFTSKRLEN